MAVRDDDIRIRPGRIRPSHCGEGLRKEVEAERWTSLDRALRNIADEHAGFVDLRPGATLEDRELRSLLIGRSSKLERLGLAESIGPAQWLKTDPG